MNDPIIEYHPCPNPSCPTNQKKGKAKENLWFIEEPRVQLDASRKQVARIVYFRCPHCGYTFTV